MLKQSRRGFTLIELLVVIAIIAILAAILFPVFARARAKAQQIKCLSNLKQLGLAMIMYASDYNELFPFGLWGVMVSPLNPDATVATTVKATDGWGNFLMPYIKNVDILRCPSRQFDNRWEEKGIPAPGYALNSSLSGYGNAVGVAWAGGVQTPCDTAMFYEYNYPSGVNIWVEYGSGYIIYGGTSAAYWHNAMEGDPAPDIKAHNGGMNVCFVDGHAKWHSAEAIEQLCADSLPPTGKSDFWGWY